jgi:hypothetical protein
MLREVARVQVAVEDNMGVLGLVLAQVLGMVKQAGMGLIMEEGMLREVVRVEVAAADKMVGLDRVLALALDMVRLADMGLMVVDMLRQVPKVVAVVVDKVVQVVVDMEVALGVGLEALAVVTHRPSTRNCVSDKHIY